MKTMRTLRHKKPINWFLIGLLALPLVAIGAYFWATQTIASLETYRSPLRTSAPAPAQPLGNPLTSRVVLVLIDALRYDTSQEASLMPNLVALRTQGASAPMTSRPPSFSAPGWTTLLTGAWPDINDSQPFNPPDEFSVRAFTQDDIFSAADRAGLSTAVSGYTWFEGLLANSGLDASFYTSGEDHQADLQVVSAALPWLDSDYALVLIHIDQVDYAGHHQGGPNSPNWDAAASRADDLLASIIARLDLTQDTLIVVSDHGQIDQGGHGGNEPVTLLEPFIAAGAAILPGEYASVQMAEVAPTLAVLLGTNLPASSQGRALLEILDISPAQAQAVLTAETAQQAALLSAYSTAIGQPASAESDSAIVSATQLALEKARMTRVAQERIWRNMIAIFLALVPGYVLFLRKEKKFYFFIISGLIYFAAFNLRYILLDKNTFGLSWIPGIMDFIIYVGLTSSLALILAWLWMVIGRRLHLQSPRQAASLALGVVWFILYILAIPILLNFAVNGFLTTWTLPVFTVQYMGFFALVQSLFVAALGLLLVGLSAAISHLVRRRTSSHA